MIKKTILYSGWVGFGNQGDDLCYDLFVRTMTQKSKQYGINLNVQGIFPLNFDEFALARINPDLVVLGAGSLFEPVYLKPLLLAQQNSIPTVIWGSGYDSLYTSPLQANFINPDMAFMIRQVVQNAKLIGIRGPYTLEMLNTIGATNSLLEIVGDPGLLLKKQDEAVSLKESQNISKPMIAVNWGTAGNKVLGGNEGAVAISLAKALTHLAKDYTVFIFPLWSKDIAPCLALYDLINQPKSTFCLKRVPNGDELIDLYQNSILSVNMKLHANVFSAASNCPFICLAYRMKNYDFASSLDWTDFTFLFSHDHLEDQIRSAILELTNHLNKYQIHLQNKREIHQTKLTNLENSLIGIIKK